MKSNWRIKKTILAALGTIMVLGGWFLMRYTGDELAQVVGFWIFWGSSLLWVDVVGYWPKGKSLAGSKT